MKRLLFGHRLWGFSLGLFFGNIMPAPPKVVVGLIMTSVIYFIFFGADHFKEKK